MPTKLMHQVSDEHLYLFKSSAHGNVLSRSEAIKSSALGS